MSDPVPAWHLYGENTPFPDILHLERIRDRAAGLDWRISPHRHAHLAQVFLLTGGQVAFMVDGVTRDMALPCLLMLPPGVVHGFAFAAGTEGWVLTLPTGAHPDLFDPQGDLGPLTGHTTITTPGPGTAPAFAALASAWQGDTAGDPLRRTRLRAHLALLFCDILGGGTDTERPDPRMVRFRDLILRHHAAHWTLDRYAAALALSPRTLSRLCRAQTGRSAQHLVEDHLMTEACRLLAYTRMSAQAIAFQLGYQDPSYFNRRFRRRTGLSPGAYRHRLEA